MKLQNGKGDANARKVVASLIVCVGQKIVVIVDAVATGTVTIHSCCSGIVS